MNTFPKKRGDPEPTKTIIDTPPPGEAVVVIVYRPESGGSLFTTSIKLDKWPCTMMLTEEPGSDRVTSVIWSMADQFKGVMSRFQSELYERFGLGNKTFIPDRK